MTDAEIRQLNEQFCTLVESGQTKQAAQTLQTVTQNRLRERGTMRKLFTLLPIQNDDLSIRRRDDHLYYVADIQPNAPAARSVAFDTQPEEYTIGGDRYEIPFCQVQSVKANKNVQLLRTYRYDLREVISDIMAMDMEYEEDSAWYAAFVDILLGQDVENPDSGIAQWQGIPGGVTRESLEDAFTILPSSVGGFEVTQCITNNITIRQIMKFGRDEMGGNYSEELLRTGKFQGDFMGAKWYVTIKRLLVPDFALYMFPEEEAIGKFLSLKPVTMWVDTKADNIEWYFYEYLGAGIGNTLSITRADFES